MKEGDIIEWRGVNRILRGTVIKFKNMASSDFQFYCRLEDGHLFSLNDLRHSKSAKLIEV